MDLKEHQSFLEGLTESFTKTDSDKQILSTVVGQLNAYFQEIQGLENTITAMQNAKRKRRNSYRIISGDGASQF